MHQFNLKVGTNRLLGHLGKTAYYFITINEINEMMDEAI